MNSSSLPVQIRKEIAKLPGVTQDIVRQKLRSPPPPPVTYEEAIEQLVHVREVEEILTKGFLAADALALWARMYNDNRALIEAQKIKAFALRQMYIAAKQLGEPSRVLTDRKVGSGRIKQGENLASYISREEMDAAADRLAPEVRRIDHLIGAVERESPAFRAMVSRNQEQQRAADEARKVAEAKPAHFANHVASVLGQIEYQLTPLVQEGALRSLSENYKSELRTRVERVSMLLDRIDQLLEKRRK